MKIKSRNRLLLFYKQISDGKLLILCVMAACPLGFSAPSLKAQINQKTTESQILSIVGRYDKIGAKPDEYDHFTPDSLDVALTLLKGDEKYYTGGIVVFISKVFKNHQKELSLQQHDRILGEMITEVRKLKPDITVTTLTHFKGVKSDLLTAFAKEMLNSPDEGSRYVAAKFLSNEPDPDEPPPSAEPPAPVAPPIAGAVPQPPSSSSSPLIRPWGLAAAAGVLATVLWLARKAYRKAQ